MKLKELTGRVESYEKVENELDQVILQAAEGIKHHTHAQH